MVILIDKRLFLKKKYKPGGKNSLKTREFKKRKVNHFFKVGSRMVYDENVDDFVPRWGANSTK